jgi:hypothetical protein
VNASNNELEAFRLKVTFDEFPLSSQLAIQAIPGNFGDLPGSRSQTAYANSALLIHPGRSLGIV